MSRVSNFDKPVTRFQRDRALRSWMAMLRGEKRIDRRRWKRCLRVLEGLVFE